MINDEWLMTDHWRLITDQLGVVLWELGVDVTEILLKGCKSSMSCDEH